MYDRLSIESTKKILREGLNNITLLANHSRTLEQQDYELHFISTHTTRTALHRTAPHTHICLPIVTQCLPSKQYKKQNKTKQNKTKQNDADREGISRGAQRKNER